MNPAPMSTVLNHLLFTLLGPDQPWCVSVSTWWNTVLCQQLTCISLCSLPFSTDEPTKVRVSELSAVLVPDISDMRNESHG